LMDLALAIREAPIARRVDRPSLAAPVAGD
jgi:hypothetical protein